MPTEWHPCLKQLTLCIIRLHNGINVAATNSCKVGDVAECPRVTAGSETGTEYELCGPPIHAEAAAASLVPEDNVGGTAYLYGHTWACKDCQDALTAKGVRTLVLTGEPVRNSPELYPMVWTDDVASPHLIQVMLQIKERVA